MPGLVRRPGRRAIGRCVVRAHPCSSSAISRPWSSASSSQFGLMLGDHQRRRQEQRGLLAAGSDHRAGLQRPLRDARGDRHLGGVGMPGAPVRAVQLHRPVQPLPRHALHARMLLRDREQAAGEQLFQALHVLQNFLFADDLQVGADGGHADRMAAQRAVILPARALEPLDDVLRHHDRSDCRRPAAERFSERHDIGAALRALEREPAACAARAGDDLVRDPVRTRLPRAARHLVLIGAVVIDAALGVVDDRRRRVREQARGIRQIFAGRRIVGRRAIDRAIGRRKNPHRCHRRRQLRAARVHREAAVPLRLHRHAARQAGDAVIGALARRQCRALRQRLAERQRHVVGLAAADAEAHRADPVLFAFERGGHQIVGGLLAADPGPAFVHDRRIGRAADRLHHRRMAMAEAAAGVAAVDQLAAIRQMKVDALAADDGHRRAVACIQPGSQQSAHRNPLTPQPRRHSHRRRTSRS